MKFCTGEPNFPVNPMFKGRYLLVELFCSIFIIKTYSLPIKITVTTDVLNKDNTLYSLKQMEIAAAL